MEHMFSDGLIAMPLCHALITDVKYYSSIGNSILLRKILKEVGIPTKNTLAGIYVHNS